MAHRFKAKKTIFTYLPKRAHIPHGVTRAQELDLRRMARLVQNEAHLAAIMMQVRAETREASLDRIRPYLPFKLSPQFSLPVAK